MERRQGYEYFLVTEVASVNDYMIRRIHRAKEDLDLLNGENNPE